MKKTIGSLPELFFMGSGLFIITEDYFALGSVNYLAVLITWLLFLQLVYKNRMAGLFYGIALGSVSVFRLTEVVSGTYDAQTAVLHSSVMLAILFSAGVFMAAIMVFKYVTAKFKYGENILTTTH